MYNVWNFIRDVCSFQLEITPSQLVKDRRAICDSCEVRNTKTDSCTACGCFIPAKIRLKKSSCPMELW